MESLFLDDKFVNADGVFGNPVTHFEGFFSLLRLERELVGREIDLFGIQRECGFQSHNL